VRRDAIQAIGGFPVGIGSGEDLLTWARLAVRYPLAYDARPLAVFVASGIERRPDPADRVGKALVQLVREHPGVPGLRRYLGLWYRMQAVMAMRFGGRTCAAAGLAGCTLRAWATAQSVHVVTRPAADRVAPGFGHPGTKLAQKS
jgi:hypothetical protein